MVLDLQHNVRYEELCPIGDHLLVDVDLIALGFRCLRLILSTSPCLGASVARWSTSLSSSGAA